MKSILIFLFKNFSALGSRSAYRTEMNTFCFTSSSSSGLSPQLFVIDKFCLKQFNNPSYTGTQINYDVQEFEKRVNLAYSAGAKLVDGYAPFCKHLFIPNFAGVRCGYVKLTDEIKSLVKSGYEARKENELPVLIQWIDSADFSAEQATFLDVILYSREQIIEENKATGEVPPDTVAPWGIISVKGQMCDHELPMQPITMMRNALGKQEGGSGVPLDRECYMRSVDFWKEHVAIK